MSAQINCLEIILKTCVCQLVVGPLQQKIQRISQSWFCLHVHPQNRHSDGPNDGRKSFRNTVVFSQLLKWDEMLHRFTVIMHSRQSCGDWMIKNAKACSMRRLFHDCKTNYNGGCACESFHLSDKMMGCMGHHKKRTKVFILAPPSTSDDNGKHNHQSNLCHLKWEECKWRPKEKICKKNVKHDTLMTIFLPKFVNRHSFVSSCAWLINLFCAT